MLDPPQGSNLGVPVFPAMPGMQSRYEVLEPELVSSGNIGTFRGYVPTFMSWRGEKKGWLSTVIPQRPAGRAKAQGWFGLN